MSQCRRGCLISLLAVVVSAAIPCGLMWWNTVKQRPVAAHVEALGGRCAWQFGMIMFVDLSGTEITDRDVAPLATVGSFRQLDVSNTKLSDDSIEYLRRITALKNVNLDGTRVTDKGVWTLCNETCVKKISVRRTAVTDAGVAALRELKPDIIVER
jgi:hypothetical protein